jgi:hypothetical protein
MIRVLYLFTIAIATTALVLLYYHTPPLALILGLGAAYILLKR